MAAAHRCSLIMLKCEEVNACQGFDSALVGIRILFSELVGMQTLPLKAPLATQPTCPLEGPRGLLLARALCHRSGAQAGQVFDQR
jgi:hypothetical protein